MRLFHSASALLTLTILALPLLASCGDHPKEGPAGGDASGSPEAGTTPDRETLLAKAIEALGGAERLAAVKSIETVATSRQNGTTRIAHHRLAFPSRYHTEIDLGGARHVLCLDGDTVWTSLEGVPLEPRDRDRKDLLEQVLMAKLGLLVGLEKHPGASIAVAPTTDGLEWLEVRFDEEDLGPYRMGFSKKTHLLARLEWQSAQTQTPVSLELDDYREVDGIMVAFRASSRREGQPPVESVADQVRFNFGPSDDLFAPPAGDEEAPVREHRTDAGRVARLVPSEGEDPATAEKRLEAWRSDQEFVRTGPAVHVRMAEGKVAEVLIPLAPDLPATEPAAPHAPHIAEQPQLHLLSLVVRDASEEAIAAASTRLEEAAKASEQELESLRLVSWREGVVQVQGVLTR